MRETRQSGFILVAALWMVAALAALASAYAAFAVNTAAGVKIPEDRMRAEAAVRGGVELAVYRLLSWPRDKRPSLGAFSARIDDFRIDVAYRAETARVDLNATPPAALAKVFQAAGMTPDKAAALAARVAAWRGKLKDEDKRREADIYRKAGLTYLPAEKPFDDALELALLPGATPEALQAALPFLTVFNGTPKINPLIAAGAALAVLPPGAAKAAQTAGEAAKLDAMPDAIKKAVSLDAGDAFRVTISAVSARMRADVEIVVSVVEGPEDPYQILSWRDGSDGAAESQAPARR